MAWEDALPRACSEDERFMKRALVLAARGARRVRPNPRVGAVVVSAGGEIVGEGYHRRAGGPHAEVLALEAAGADARGGTLYLTLEPCSHQGRTPPCAPRVVASGVSRVVIAHEDPFPEVSGAGICLVRDASVDVAVGVLADEARALNAGYLKVHAEGLPLVLAKWAMSLDGKTATASGQSQWISCEASRRYVHRLRSRADAVLVGIGTVLADDPELTTRHVRGATPMRVVVDSTCRTPPSARLLATLDIGPVLIAVTDCAPTGRIEALRECGAEVLLVGAADGRVDMEAMLRALVERDVQYVLAEGGAELHGALFAGGLVDRVAVFTAPIVIGGAMAPGAVGGAGIEALADAAALDNPRTRRMGTDVVLEGDVSRGPAERM